MVRFKRIKIGKRFIEAVWVKLQTKNFILLKGRKGYIMCGYLNLDAAEKFSDVAVKIIGVSTIKEALNSKVADSTILAKNLGIVKDMPVKEVLKIIV